MPLLPACLHPEFGLRDVVLQPQSRRVVRDQTPGFTGEQSSLVSWVPLCPPPGSCSLPLLPQGLPLLLLPDPVQSPLPGEPPLTTTPTPFPGWAGPLDAQSSPGGS